jgi:MFS family permease
MAPFITGRFVQGLGAGAISAMSLATVGRAYAHEAKPRILALLATAWVAPGLLGPAIAGAIADLAGWRWVFFALAPIATLGAAIATPPLWRLEPAPASGERDRTLSALALAVGVGLFLLGLGLEQIALGGILTVVGLTIGVRSFVDLVPAGTLRARTGIPAAIAVMGLISFAFFGAEAYVPLALSDVRGQPVAVVGLPLTCGTLAWTAGTWVQAREAKRRSRRAMIATGLALLGVGIGLVALVLSPRAPLLLAAIAWAIAGVGMGIAYSTTSLVVLEMAAPSQAGAASASLQLSSVLGIALGTGVGGAILAGATALGRSTAWAIAALDALALLGVVLGLAAARRVPGRPPPA